MQAKRSIHRRALAALSVLVLATGAPTVQAAEDVPPEALAPRRISSIDFYGLRRLQAQSLLEALPVHEGDLAAMADGDRLRSAIRMALSAKPLVQDVQSSFVCCDAQGGVALFVGVREEGAPALRFRAPPIGAARLPADLIAADQALDRALFKAVQAGRSQEDDSEGHALLTNDPEARALQEQRVALAARHLFLLRQVLLQSADGGQRAMAARYLGYAPDKQAVVGDLVQAVDDPDGGVRNDAVRALMVFTHAKNPPHVPYEPFIALLDSSAWTDLNKASAALDGLTARRDPSLLALLRQRSLPALVSIARWKSRPHARPGYDVVGRIAGYSDADLQAHWDARDIEPVIAAALASGGPRQGSGAHPIHPRNP